MRNRLCPLLLLPLVVSLACGDKDPIEEAMEEMDLSIDIDAISICDEEPSPDPSDRDEEEDGDASHRSGGSRSSGSHVSSNGSTITENEIVDVVNRRKGQVRSCYEKELKSDPYIAGVVSVAWTVTSGGGVSNVRVLSNSTGNPDISRCIVRTVGRWSFPSSHGEAVDVEYPFRFTPGV